MGRRAVHKNPNERDTITISGQKKEKVKGSYVRKRIDTDAGKKVKRAIHKNGREEFSSIREE